jgi:transposase
MTGSVSKAEILPGPERRRRWSVDQKLAIVAEMERAGSSGSAVARRYGISTGLLYTWRRQSQGLATRSRGRTSKAAPASFLPVVVRPEEELAVVALSPPTEASIAPPSIPVPAAALEGGAVPADGVIEIELSGGHRLRVDRHVDAEALRRVLSVLGA